MKVDVEAARALIGHGKIIQRDSSDETIARVLREQEARLDEARQERLLRWHITSSEGQGELDAVVSIEKERLTGMHMLAAALREER